MSCRNDHQHRGPQDRLPNGQCRACDRVNQATHRARRKLALALLKQMEAAGLKQSDLNPGDGFAIGLAWANAAGDTELQKIELEHPTLVDKFRRRIERIEAGR